MVSFLCTLILFFTAVSAMPLTQLAARADNKCADGRLSPCACNGALGLRQKTLACPTANSFQFVQPNEPTGRVGTIHSVAGNQGNLQCDHIVELQFIATQIAANPAICTHFQSTAGGADFQAFFNIINKSPNLAEVESTVNGAKGVLFGNKNFGIGTTAKAADGVASYLGLLKGTKVKAAAKVIDDKMTSIMTAVQGTGFTNFVANYEAAIDTNIAKANTQKANLSPAPVAGDPFVIVTDCVAKAGAGKKTKRELAFWGSARDFVIRAITGKKSTTTATTGAACPLPPPKGATTGVSAATAAATAKPKDPAVPKAKPATTTKPATKPATPKAPVKATPAKKPATKATTAQKTAVNPVAKKPVTKVTTAKKPATVVKKPTAKITAKKAKKL